MRARSVVTLMLACLSGLVGWASAAGFDCTKARSRLEAAICGNPDLAALDERVNEAYRAVVQGAGDTDAIREHQRVWLTNLADVCGPDEQIAACLAAAYARRISLLQGVTATTQQQDTPAGFDYARRDLSARYDFIVRLNDPCTAPSGADDWSCEGPGTLSVLRKGEQRRLHFIPLEYVGLRLTRTPSAPLIEAAGLNPIGDLIIVGDFNFDGQEDFGIADGDVCSYGEPSYDIYLRSAKHAAFRFSAPLTRLSESSVRCFDVDAERKRLVTYYRKNLGYHETTEFAVVNDQPVPVVRLIDYAQDEKLGVEHEERWIDGRWQRVNTVRSLSGDYCETAAQATAGGLGHHARAPNDRTCKLLPWGRHPAAVAVRYSSGDKGAPQRRVGLDLFLVDLDDDRILARYSEPDEFAANYPEQYVIDTAPYRLTPRERAFGIRCTFHPGGGHAGYELLTLFYQQGDRLIPVLRHLVVAQDTDTTAIRRTLEMGQRADSGFADIIVRETAGPVPGPGPESSAATGPVPVAAPRVYTLRFDGSRYVLPAELAAQP